MVDFDFKIKICVIGLGYVGLPLAQAFSKNFPVIGFDTDSLRVQEVESSEEKYRIAATSAEREVRDVDVWIIAVPTPVDVDNEPDLEAVKQAFMLVRRNIKKKSVVIVESTVAPGTTEELAAEILDQPAGLQLNKDYWLGYSPERINPGDSERGLSNVVKVVSASCPEALEFMAQLYKSVVNAGVHKASSIKVAEAAKVLENIQRDVNIGLMNEMANLFDSAGIDTGAVIEAAKTKWNFADFSPGLVGGHCVGVDPYYMLHFAADHQVGLAITSAARYVNESQIDYKVRKVAGILGTSAKLRILFLGITFKADCDDIRNSKNCELMIRISKLYPNLKWHDPYFGKFALPENEQLKLCDHEVSAAAPKDRFDVVVIGALHTCYQEFGFVEAIGDRFDFDCRILDITGKYRPGSYNPYNFSIIRS